MSGTIIADTSCLIHLQKIEAPTHKESSPTPQFPSMI